MTHKKVSKSEKLSPNFCPEILKLEQSRLAKEGLYCPELESSACGVGLIASIDGKSSRSVTTMAIDALKALWHRGAVDPDGKTGDGAGIHLQIPEKLFRTFLNSKNINIDKGKISAGQIFLPKNNQNSQKKSISIVEEEALRIGMKILGWRDVPINLNPIGKKALATLPEIKQILIENNSLFSDKEIEKNLFIMRKRIEKRIISEKIENFYICSLSCRSIIYKGLFLAEQLSSFYPDLLEDSFISNFAVYHQRFSTNTFPSWSLAQPFRILAHNGEINTHNGNVNWMTVHEREIASSEFGEYLSDISPIIPSQSSDSASLDAAFELLIRSGHELPETKDILMPKAWEQSQNLPQNHSDFYRFVAATIEPWDGPASICAYYADWALAGLDRNGLRPLRYTLSKDNFLFIGSETGMTHVPPENVKSKGRIGPGDMIAVNLKEGKLYSNHKLKHIISQTKDFHSLTENIIKLEQIEPQNTKKSPTPIKTNLTTENIVRQQNCVGWNMEDMELLLHTMAESGKEATGSMGDDSPLAVLTQKYRGLQHFFRQNFSQVTNPAVDSLRERYVMSLTTYLGNLHIANQSQNPNKVIELTSPILSLKKLERLYNYLDSHNRISFLETSFCSSLSLERAVSDLCSAAENLIVSGKDIICLVNNEISENRLLIPSILSTGAIHRHLLDNHLRHKSSIIVMSAEIADVHPVAVLIGVGADVVVPYLAEISIINRHERGLFSISKEKTLTNYYKSLEDGLLKIMAKSGISVLSSYRGGANFEALGLSHDLVSKFFPSMPSRISGIGLKGIECKIRSQHQTAFNPDNIALPVGGFYRLRSSSGEQHSWDAKAIQNLQASLNTGSYKLYKRFSDHTLSKPPSNLRDLLEFNKILPSIDIDKVEPANDIRKRLITPGVSLGALSLAAHETLAIAMNRIGCRSDSGEGGEDPERYNIRSNGDNPCSAIKQVASGRFGVTNQYLNNCREIEIKIAQGAKPGEGGQLPGIKVSSMIARLRHSTPGITLISPPPHHDIYSIEDLAQLIYDLKQVNSEAEICVKLVARSGIGAIASGVAKAHADVILISGHSGGTGASPQSSIKYAGLPWEIGLAEVHQVLSMNNQRDTIKLRTDGGLQNGRDIVVAAILGAEEFGIGTASLIAMGCLMVRQCHSNTCPVGVCTQNEKLIEKFTGTPEKVINLFSFLAQEVREILASLGVSSLNQIIGKTELLKQMEKIPPDLDSLNLSALLTKPLNYEGSMFCTRTAPNPVAETLDKQIEKDAQTFLKNGQKTSLNYNIHNTDRSIGTRISSLIVKNKLEVDDNALELTLNGSAGQSLGAFAVKGVKLNVIGDANDYVGKGLSGATIVLTPPALSKLDSINVIAGNTLLYGATSGKLFAAGTVGERFSVRNSGAIGVVEGCGDNGCEYMTGGKVAILGNVGENFAAGMTGGQAFLFDPERKIQLLLNAEFVRIYPLIKDNKFSKDYYELVYEHCNLTKSSHAKQLLNNWEKTLEFSWHIVPSEIAVQLKDLPDPADISLLQAS